MGKEEEEELLGVLRSGWLTTGPRTKAFEAAFGFALKLGISVTVMLTGFGAVTNTAKVPAEGFIDSEYSDATGKLDLVTM